MCRLEGRTDMKLELPYVQGKKVVKVINNQFLLSFRGNVGKTETTHVEKFSLECH